MRGCGPAGPLPLLLLLPPLGRGPPVERARRLGSDDSDDDRDVVDGEVVDARCPPMLLAAMPPASCCPSTVASCLRVELSRVRPAAIRQPEERSIVKREKEVQRG